MEKKILLLGLIGTGKTSFCQQLVNQQYTTTYTPTISVSQFYLKEKDFQVNLYEVAGQELLYGNMGRLYYKNTDAVLIFVDMTRSTSVDEAIKWKTDYESMGPKCPIYLVLNKRDLITGDYTEVSKNFTGTFEISCKNYLDCSNLYLKVVSNLRYNTNVNNTNLNNTNVNNTNLNTQDFIKKLLEMMSDSDNFKYNYIKLCLSSNKNDDLTKLINFTNSIITTEMTNGTKYNEILDYIITNHLIF